MLKIIAIETKEGNFNWRAFDNLRMSMKYIMKSLLLALIAGCADTPEEAPAEEPQVVETPTVDTNTIAPPPSLVDSSASQLYWWDSLISDDGSVRIEAMNKYKEVRSKNNKDTSQNSEIVAGYVKTFFSSHPEEFLSVYTGMTEPERKTVQRDLTNEFYVAGAEYKSYLDEYFSNIQNSCDSCSDQEKTSLKDIRQKIEADVKKKIDADAKKANQ